MKKSLIAASLFLLASAAHAEDHYKIQAQVTQNGKSVGDYSAVVASGSTARFVAVESRKYIASAQYVDGKLDSQVEGAVEAGLTFTGTPVPTSDGKILLNYTAEYSEFEPITGPAPVSQDVQSLGAPDSHSETMGGAFIAASGVPIKGMMANRKDATEFTFTVTKL